MARLKLSPDARRDIVSIGVDIARRSGSRETARRFLNKVMGVCDLLASNPEMGELRTELATAKYRSFTVGHYVIYFKATLDGVHVARILHGSRDHGELL
jgi:toxin ParE1/3/4